MCVRYVFRFASETRLKMKSSEESGYTRRGYGIAGTDRYERRKPLCCRNETTFFLQLQVSPSVTMVKSHSKDILG